jgi:hypothetical protein
LILKEAGVDAVRTQIPLTWLEDTSLHSGRALEKF